MSKISSKYLDVVLNASMTSVIKHIYITVVIMLLSIESDKEKGEENDQEDSALY